MEIYNIISIIICLAGLLICILARAVSNIICFINEHIKPKTPIQDPEDLPPYEPNPIYEEALPAYVVTE